MKDIAELLKHKQLARLDFGTVEIVKPTGRYIDSYEFQQADLIEQRHRFIVEVKTGLSYFFTKKWVSASLLKPLNKL